MDTRTYDRVLLRLLLLPLVGLVVLALGLGYSLHRVEKSAARVDHTDKIIARTNRLIGLMVDEETGVRGYFLTHDASFLQPYERAQSMLPQEFETLSSLIGSDTSQSARLEQLRRSHARWDALTARDIQGSTANIQPEMRVRKRSMDDIRRQANEFLKHADITRRAQFSAASRMGTYARLSLWGLLILLGRVNTNPYFLL